MNVPDGLVWASIAPTAAASGFLLKLVVQKFSGESAPATFDVAEMSVKQLNALSGYLVEKLNGRYMMASEARARFDKIERGMADQHEKLQGKIHHDMKNLMVEVVRAIDSNHPDAAEVLVRKINLTPSPDRTS